MIEKEVVPKNALEKALLKAKSDGSSMGAFLTELVRSNVFVLADKAGYSESGFDPSINLCVLTNRSGSSVVPVFTAQELATPWHERQAHFRYGILVDAASLINGLESGVGLVLNPGTTVGVEIPSDVINSIKQQLSSRQSAT